jgi:hypothetical protein
MQSTPLEVAMPSACRKTHRAVCQKQRSEIVVVDSRKAMDLTLELTFVLATKTLLSANFCPVLLPLRFDVIFEKHMRFAGLLMDVPELDFQKSSRSLRQFAKAMEKNGFLVLNTGAETDEELRGAISGLVVTALRHSNIDDIYPDSSVFAIVGVRDDVERGVPTEGNDVDGQDDNIEELLCDAPGQPLCASLRAAKIKERQLQGMLLLQDLYAREEARLEQLQQNVEKAALKAVERQFRKLNIRCNVERVRGQDRKGKSSKDKYQTVTHGDRTYLEFYARHSSKGRGALLMLAVQQKTKHLENKTSRIWRLTAGNPQIAELTDNCMQKTHSMIGFGSTVSGGTSPETLCEERVRVEHAHLNLEGLDLSGTWFDFTDTNATFERSADMRGGSKQFSKKQSAPTAQVDIRNTAVGVNFSLSRKHREFLSTLGVGACHTLLALPSFAALRQSYKQALLKLHPDKKCTEALSVAKDENVKGVNGPEKRALTSMPFHEFQERYQEFVAVFYDVENQDFNAGVKKHLSSGASCTKSARVSKTLQKQYGSTEHLLANAGNSTDRDILV